MATRTIDILLNLDAKPKGTDQLAGRFSTLEKRAKTLQKAIDEITSKTFLGSAGKVAAARVDAIRSKLDAVKHEMRGINDEAKKRILEKNLKAATDQANRLRERMEKLTQVGNRLALAGGAILAPLTLAVRKYLELADENDPVAKRMKKVGEAFTDFQVRLGKVVADEILPLLERAVPYLDKAITWLEANPDAVSAALTLGGTLVSAGAILSTAGTIVNTLATLKTLGLGLGGLGAAGGGAGLSAAISSAIATAAPILAIAAAVVLAAEGTRRFVNWALGTDTTWKDIGVTVKQLLFILEFAFTQAVPRMVTEIVTGIGKNAAEIATKLTTTLLNNIRAYFTNLSMAIRTGLQILAQGISGAISRLASVLGLKKQSVGTQVGTTIKKASGGYLARQGMFMGAEGNKREFVLSNSTTRAAENVIGGNLTQAGLIQALGARRVTYHDSRRFDASVSARDREMIRDETIRVLAGAF